jgi:hypothetical protein
VKALKCTMKALCGIISVQDSMRKLYVSIIYCTLLDLIFAKFSKPSHVSLSASVRDVD